MLKAKISLILCFLFPLAIGLSFPLQVISGRTIAGASSLIVILFLYVILIINRGLVNPIKFDKTLSVFDGLILLLLLLSILNAFIGLLTNGSLFSNEIFMILTAGLIYLYFSRLATNRQIDYFIAGMVIMGIISATFYVYDSINKVVYQGTTTYALMAHKYSIASAGSFDEWDPDQNNVRIDWYYRSFGLLERHSTSALWILFGFYAFVIRSTNPFFRRIAFMITLITLLITQNFTSLFVFFATLFLFRFKVVSIKYIAIAFLPLLFVLLIMNKDTIQLVFDAMSFFLMSHIGEVFGVTNEFNDSSFFSLVLIEITRYVDLLIHNPLILLLGFGLGTSKYYGTSGDVGFIESIARLGLPLWFFLTWRIILVFRRALRRKKSKQVVRNSNNTYLLFAATILSSIWLMDIHYSTWVSKSVFAILLFAFGIASREYKKVQ
jgi:hypothetical protein